MFGIASALMFTTSVFAENKPAAWTIMVYMNAKNNLENDGIQNFLEMASLPMSSDINLLVAMGRPARHLTTEYGAWSGVRLFHITKGLTPTSEHAEINLNNEHLDDMGSTRPLERLLLWGKERYPAVRYMLIIWNHGQGWRLQLTKDEKIRDASAAGRAPDLLRDMTESQLPPPPASFKSVSFDDDKKTFLYNRDIQEALLRLRPAVALSVIGFDACLMSMIETAYAMRGVAETMVGSEELEPGAGWPYKEWLQMLAKNPRASSRDISKMLVDAYRTRYGDVYRTTQSAIVLSAVSDFAKRFSILSGHIQNQLATELSSVRAARAGIHTYGEEARLHTSVDLGLFLERYGSLTHDPKIAEQARSLRAAVDKELVIDNYASNRVQGNYGSHGIAFYFPETKQQFDSDSPNNRGYDPTIHDQHSVEFVEKETWPKLLLQYLKSK
jgi:hypothetical protein